MTFLDFEQVIWNNLVAATGFAAFIFGLTFLLYQLFSDLDEDELRKMLTKPVDHTDWSQSFLLFFEKLFGQRHLSLKCVLWSCVLSLLSVSVVWIIMGQNGLFEDRLQLDLKLSTTIGIALTVNLLADYFSLWETRLVLKNLYRFSKAWMQFGILLADLAVSALIIFGFIFVHRYFSPDVGGDDTFSDILGAFSLYSVMFYSTFATSIWSWIYWASLLIFRTVSSPRIGRRLKIDQHPVAVLASANFVVAGCSYLLIAFATEATEAGVSPVDRGLCWTFRNDICLSIAELSDVEDEQIELVVVACRNGLTEECRSRGLLLQIDDPKTARQLWAVACDAGDGTSCANNGWIYTTGAGVEPDPRRALELRKRGCELGSGFACSSYGWALKTGVGTTADLDAAAIAYEQSCHLGHGRGCDERADLYRNADYLGANVELAAHFYRLGCDADYGVSCGELARLYRGGGVEEPEEGIAISLFAKGCELNSLWSCENAARLTSGAEKQRYTDLTFSGNEERCDKDDGWSCGNLGKIYWEGVLGQLDLELAASFFERGCSLENAYSCHMLGDIYANGEVFEQNFSAAAEHYQIGCDLHRASSCGDLGDLYRENRLGLLGGLRAGKFYGVGCELLDAWSCKQLAIATLKYGGSQHQFIRAALYYERASRVFEIECERGRGWACGQIADFFENGLLGAEDTELAYSWFDRGCKNENGWSCARAADLLLAAYVEGNHDPIQLLESGCYEFGSGYACSRLGYINEAGAIVRQDLSDSLAAYRRACDLERASACVIGAEILSAIKELYDPEVELELLDRSCLLESADGCFKAALSTIALERREFSSKEPLTAVGDTEVVFPVPPTIEGFDQNGLWASYHEDVLLAVLDKLTKGCMLGETTGCDLMTEARFGSSEEVGYLQLVDYCEAGHSWACHWAALRIMTVTNSRNSLDTAIPLLENACLLGHKISCTSLAQLVSRDHEAGQDLQFSVLELYQIGCSPSNALGCLGAARIMERYGLAQSNFFLEDACDYQYLSDRLILSDVVCDDVLERD